MKHLNDLKDGAIISGKISHSIRKVIAMKHYKEIYSSQINHDSDGSMNTSLKLAMVALLMVAFASFLVIIDDEGTLDPEGMQTEIGTSGVSWEITDGVLTLTGSGAIPNYGKSADQPWHDYADTVKKIIFDDESTITTIGNYSFSGMTEVHEVIFNDHLRIIGNYAFAYCTGLEYAVLPSSLAQMGKYVFRECTSLESIYFPESLDTIPDYACYLCSSLSSVTIPDTVTSIGSCAFYGCNLQSLTLPSSLTYLGSSAFRFNYEMGGYIDIPAGITQLNGHTFGGTSITGISDWGSITQLGNGEFANNNTITKLILPEGITEIGGGLYAGCRYLEEVHFPSTLQTMGETQMYLVPSLKTVTVQEGSQYFEMRGPALIGIIDKVLYGYVPLYNAASYTIPDDVTRVATRSISSTAYLTSLIIPGTSVSFGDHILQFTNVVSVTISSGFSGTFYGPTSFENDIGYLEIIDLRADYEGDYSEMTSYTTEGIDDPVNPMKLFIRNSAEESMVEQVEGYYYFALTDSENVTTVNVIAVPYSNFDYIIDGDTFDGLGDTITLRALRFEGMGQNDVTVKDVNLLLQTFKRSVLKSVELTNVTTIGAGSFNQTPIQSIIIGEGTTTIGEDAFNMNGDPMKFTLKSITLPSTVTTIGNNAFHGYTSLESVTILGSVTDVGTDVFSGCTGLKQVTLGNISSIPTGMFSGCTSLVSIVLPSNVDEIGENTFLGCTSLESITFTGTRAQSDLVPGADAFASGSDGVIIYYEGNPFASSTYADGFLLPAYSGDTEVKLVHGTIIPGTALIWFVEDGTLTVAGNGDMPTSYTAGSDAPWYAGYSSTVTSLYVESGVTGVGPYCFAALINLANVYLPSSMSTISSNSFSGDTKIALLDLLDLESTAVVAADAFDGSLSFVSGGNSVTVTSIKGSEWSGEGTGTLNMTAGNTGSLSFKFDDTTRSLTISGSGSMGDYSDVAGSRSPWYEYKGSIETVVLRGNITTIGAHAFEGCTSLGTPTFPNTLVTIGAYAFSQCTDSDFKDVVVPASVTSIGERAFSGAYNLGSIELGSDDPATLTTASNCFDAGFGHGSSQDKDALTVEIRGNLFEISDFAGTYSDVTGLTLGSLDEKCGDALYYYLTGKTAVIYGSGDMYDYDNADNISPFVTAMVYEVTFTGTPASIGDYAFYGLTSLASVNSHGTMPSSIKAIGDYAFSNTHVTALDLSDVTTLGQNVFSGSYILTADLSSIESIGTSAFSQSKVETVVLNQDLTSLPANCFNNATNLSEINLDNIQTIGGWIFTNCTSLPKIDDDGLKYFYMPSLTTVDGNGVFKGMGIQRLELPATCDSMGQNMIEGSSLQELIIRNPNMWLNASSISGDASVTALTMPINTKTTYLDRLAGMLTTIQQITLIGSGASQDYTSLYTSTPWYSSRESLATIIVSDGITSITANTFKDLTAVTSVTLGESVATIGSSAFQGCSTLTAIDLSDVTVIGDSAFSGCTSLAQVVLNSSTASIGVGILSGTTSVSIYIDEVSEGSGELLSDSSYRPLVNKTVFDAFLASESSEGGQMLVDITATGAITARTTHTLDMHGHAIFSDQEAVGIFTADPTVVDTLTDNQYFEHDGSWSRASSSDYTAYTVGGAMVANGTLLDKDRTEALVAYNLTDATATLSQTEYVLTEEIVESGAQPTLTSLTIDGLDIPADQYQVSYLNNKAAGTAYLVLQSTRDQEMGQNVPFVIAAEGRIAIKFWSAENYTHIVTDNSQSIMLPEADPRDGYDFAGWYLLDEQGEYKTLIGFAGQYYYPSTAADLHAKYVMKSGTDQILVQTAKVTNSASANGFRLNVNPMSNLGMPDGTYYVKYTITYSDGDTIKYKTLYSTGETSEMSAFGDGYYVDVFPDLSEYTDAEYVSAYGYYQFTSVADGESTLYALSPVIVVI